jgi:hypothetical protein
VRLPISTARVAALRDDRRRTHQPHDPEASAEALFGMRATLQDQLAQLGGGGADRSGGAANALEGSIGPRVGATRPRTGAAPMARRHVLGNGGVPVVAAGAPMRVNPLAFKEDLDGLRRLSTAIRIRVIPAK